MPSSSWLSVKKDTVLTAGVGLRAGALITSSSKVEMMVPLSLNFFSFKDKGPWSGMFSWLHLVRIGSSTMSKTTHCSATSPLTLIASIQEAEGGLIPYLILQPFCHCVRVFSITHNLFYGLKWSSGSRRVGTTGRRNFLSIRELNRRLSSRMGNWNWSRRGRNGFCVINRMHFDGRSVELWRRTPSIRRRLWRTHSRDRRTLAVSTPAQLHRHLLSLNGQLSSPVLILLEAGPQQDTLFPLLVNILPMVIHPFLMFSLSPSDLILQVFDNGLQLFDLSPQSHHLRIIVVVLECGLVSYSSQE